MVLVDSSAWIAHLYGKAAFTHALSRLGEDEAVLGHEFVYGELLMGDIGGGRARLLADYRRYEHAKTVPHREVVDLVRARKLHGRGIGWVDAQLIAAALAAGAQLLTNDAALRDVAETLGIAHAL